MSGLTSQAVALVLGYPSAERCRGGTHRGGSGAPACLATERRRRAQGAWFDRRGGALRPDPAALVRAAGQGTTTKGEANACTAEMTDLDSRQELPFPAPPGLNDVLPDAPATEVPAAKLRLITPPRSGLRGCAQARSAPCDGERVHFPSEGADSGDLRECWHDGIGL